MKALSKYACSDTEAIRFQEEKEDIYRTPFFHDIDRIIYSMSYLRYADKTQVFTFNENDHISKRMIHVQLVSKIARTIGRNLELNEDLIEAAALGHDLGHVPFGHVGEAILNKISLENNEGYFNHNIESVRLLMNIEQNGQGRNLTLQVLDAIMCHNGELPMQKYSPKIKTKEEFLEEYNNSYKEENYIKKLRPMTLEGCVVRVCDIIAYIGKDIEDAITLGIIKKDEIPKNITNVLGTTNREIINTIVKDIIVNSKDKPYIEMSKEIYEALVGLKKFNYENIYSKANTKDEIVGYENMFRSLFNKYKNDVENKEKYSIIWQTFLHSMSNEYLSNTSASRKVIDFIAGMTDDYIKKCYLKDIENVK
jgi:dGTPase